MPDGVNIMGGNLCRVKLTSMDEFGITDLNKRMCCS